MTEELLDISCPICGKKDKAGWWDSDDDNVMMFCTRCNMMYAVMNNGTKILMTSMNNEEKKTIESMEDTTIN